jgi:hypothetical protein
MRSVQSTRLARYQYRDQIYAELAKMITYEILKMMEWARTHEFVDIAAGEALKRSRDKLVIGVAGCGCSRGTKWESD